MCHVKLTKKTVFQPNMPIMWRWVCHIRNQCPPLHFWGSLPLIAIKVVSKLQRRKTAIEMSILFLTVFLLNSLIILELKQPIARVKSQRVTLRSKANIQRSMRRARYNVTYIPYKVNDARSYVQVLRGLETLESNRI
jgi:hypothetical protein